VFGLNHVSNTHLLSSAVRQLRNAARTPVLIGGTLGFLLALRVRPSALRVTGPLLVLVLVAYGGITVLRLPVPDRMLLTPAVMLAILCAFVVVGWRDRPAGAERRLWAVGGVAVLALLVATAPAEISRLQQLNGRRAGQQRVTADLLALGHSPAARSMLADCRQISVGLPETVPYVAYYLNRPLHDISVTNATTPARGAYFALASRQAVESVLGAFESRATNVPPGFRGVAANRSWRVYRSGC
jgi:hypothetical protein